MPLFLSAAVASHQHKATLMNSEQGTEEQRSGRKREPNKVQPPAVETEAAQMGGKEPAQRQAERDWENSPKESGE